MGENGLTYQEHLARERKAREIVAAGAVHRDGREGVYEVESQSGPGSYTVNVHAGECDCADYRHRGAYCKHIRAAEIIEARDEDRDPMEPDYDALAREEFASEYEESRDAAGMFNPTRGGLSEGAWEYADHVWDGRVDRL